MSQPVLEGDEGRIRLLTLNRPETRNALGRVIVEPLKGALSRAGRDASVRAIVLTGAGKAFCAGADLKALQALTGASPSENLEDSRRLKDLYLSILRCPKPVIAAVNGPALAGGCGLAILCDAAVAAEGATFGYPEPRIGFVAAMVLVFLQRAVGDRLARELLLTGRILDARKALEAGLVQKIAPPEKLLEDSFALAEEMALGAPSSLAFTKELLFRTSGMPLEEALEMAAQVNAVARSGEELKEGVAAFLEKRSPSWQEK